MKGIAIVALLFGLAAAGASGYGMVETKPNLDATQARVDEGSSEGTLAQLEQDSLRDYKQTLGRLVVGAWGAGLLALILGIVAMRKGAKGLGAVAVIIGLAGAILGAVIMPQPLLL
jgi:hypothetical protein